MSEITRRDFVGFASLAGALGAMGMASFVGLTPEQALAAEEAVGGEALGDASAGKTTELASDTDRAMMPSGRLNPVRLATDLTDEELDAQLLDEAEITGDYTTPSGVVIPAVFLRLRNRINRIGFGVGSNIEGDKEWDFFMRIFTEEDAEHYMKMPMFKMFNANDYGALCGLSEAEASEVCEDMANRGLLHRRRRAGVNYYYLLTCEFGIWEANIDHYFDDGFMEDHNNRLGMNYGPALNDSVRPMCHIAPVSRDIVKGDMVPYTDYEEIIKRQEWLAVSPCQCRTRKDILGIREESCAEEHPMETCTTTGELAQYYIEHGIGRQITPEESLEILHNNIESGLVPELLFTKQTEVICSCHSDCCLLLGNIRALNGEGNAQQYISYYDLEYDADKCIGCGLCVDRCPMISITLEDGKCIMDKACIRCGHCAVACPQEARCLVPKDPAETLELPDDMVDDYHQAAKIRMAEGYIFDFTGEK